jgi:regulator of protease activity HflC (stomatin/prohibitin superfamily)
MIVSIQGTEDRSHPGGALMTAGTIPTETPPVARAVMTERIKSAASGLGVLAVIIVAALAGAALITAGSLLAPKHAGSGTALGLLIGAGAVTLLVGALAMWITGRAGRAAPAPGVVMLAVLGALVAAGLLVLGIVLGGQYPQGLLIGTGISIFIVVSYASRGLTPVVPGEARVVQLFGRYLGTIRKPGLVWVNPFTERRKVSFRIRNYETQVAKVNDADGNPIEIAAVVVWSVEDTAKALYDVDDFARFVDIQTETAVRHVASTHPYDAHEDGQLSLRVNASEITTQLTAEIAERVSSAGVKIVESRLTRLSFAPEIAQAMLRRQQASAVVAARRTIVDGAVGMVEMALARIEERGIVDLDAERKAAMVSNLLVVLCSEQNTQPIVNAGTLYN